MGRRQLRRVQRTGRGIPRTDPEPRMAAQATTAGREGGAKQRPRARSRRPAKVRSAKAEQVVNPRSIDNPESPETDGQRNSSLGAAEVSV